MRLLELKILEPGSISDRDISWYLDTYYYGRKGSAAQKEIETSDPNIRLAVDKSPAGKTFQIFVLLKNKEGGHRPEGFIEFVWPEKWGQRKAWAENVRSAHSGLKPELRGKGVAKMVYKWFLDAGNILVTANRQTPDSNALWKSLASEYEVVFFDDKGQFIDAPTPAQAQRKNVRMALLGKGQTREDLFK